MAMSIVAKPLKLGEIAIIEQDWRLTFKCDYCHTEIENFKTFLNHTLNHFFELKEYEVHDLCKTVLSEPKAANAPYTEVAKAANVKTEISDMAESDELEFLYQEAIAEADIVTKTSLTINNLDNTDNDYEDDDDDDDDDEEEEEHDDDDMSLDEALFEATDSDDNEDACAMPKISQSMLASHKQLETHALKTSNKRTFEKVYLHIQKCDDAANTNAHNTEQFVCPFCEKSFANNQNLTYHIRRHTNKYPCDRCDAVFNDVNNHRRHYARHLGKKPHACSVCDKRFLTKTELKKHAATHSKLRPFTCEDCNATFRSMAGYEIHRLKHTNTRPFECKLCDKAFFEKRQLDDHVKLHTSEFPYECAECGKQFKTRRPYQAHCRTLHADKKVYECQYCPQVFQERIELFWHLKRNHWKKTNKNSNLNINQIL